MDYKSVFDIIGPIMIGPSSSHTAGAVRIGRVARDVFGETPKIIKAYFYGSFAETYQGHGTDVAIIGGLLGFETSDPNIPKSIDIAKDKNISVEFIASDKEGPHPNTAKLIISKDEVQLNITGISIGGGNIKVVEINDFHIETKDSMESFVIVNNKSENLDNLLQILKNEENNISYKNITRKDFGNLKIILVYPSPNFSNHMKSLIDKIDRLDKDFKIIQIN